MSDQKSDGLEQWAIKQIQEHGLTEIAFVLLIIIGIFVAAAWYLGKRYGLKGIALDNRKKEAELIDKLIESRKSFLVAKETFNMSLVNMRDVILAKKTGTKSEADLRSCFDEMCRLYEHSYLSTLSEYLERMPTLVGKVEAYDRVKNEIMPALKTMRDFLQVANKLIPDVLPGARFPIRRESRDGLFDSVVRCIPFVKRKLRNELKEIKMRTDEYLREE